MMINLLGIYKLLYWVFQNNLTFPEYSYISATLCCVQKIKPKRIIYSATKVQKLHWILFKTKFLSCKASEIPRKNDSWTTSPERPLNTSQVFFAKLYIFPFEYSLKLKVLTSCTFLRNWLFSKLQEQKLSTKFFLFHFQNK